MTTPETYRATRKETNIIRLSAEDQIRFVEQLLNPPPASSAILKALERNLELFGVNYAQ